MNPAVAVKACLHEGGVPQIGEVTRLGGVTRLSKQSLILMWSRLHVRWGDPPHVTSPTWGPPPSRKPALIRSDDNGLLAIMAPERETQMWDE